MAETELERAEKRYAQAKARLLALKNRAATQARKLDTRRKVILGGALVDLATRDQGAAAMLDRLVRNLPREQDRKAFVGWTPGDALPEAGAADGGSDRTLDGKTDRAAGNAINSAAKPGSAVVAGRVEPAAEPPSAARFPWKANRALRP
jgi:hypothetical protein